MSPYDNEILREAYFDLEQSREKEVQSRLISDCILTAITIVSANNDQTILYEQLFSHIKSSIGFSTAHLFQVITEGASTFYKSVYTTGPVLDKPTGNLPAFIEQKLSSKKAINVFEVNERHNVYSMLGSDGESVKSLILIPIKSKISTYIVTLLSNEKFYYSNAQNDLATKFMPIFSQAINQGEYIAYMLQASKMSALGEMASGIAHEINNPLAIIKLSTKSLKRMHEKGASSLNEFLEVLEMIDNTINRISKIVTGMRTVSRQSEQVDYASLTLGAVLNDVLGMFAEKLKSGSVALEINVNAPELQEAIVSDQVRLSQVFINLIGNAYDAVKETPGAWLKLHFESQKDLILVKIIDSGNGIPTELLDRIFSPFFTTKAIGKGTGLGLGISKGIMEKLGGKLELNSLSINTCFVVSIPRLPCGK